MKNKVVVFDYEGNWMIVLYKDNVNTKYWNGDEDYWDDVWDYIELLQETSGVEIIEPKLNTYEEINKFQDEYNDIFNLTEEDFEFLRRV